MPSVFSHAIAAVAVGTVAIGGPSRAPVWVLGAVCAVAPEPGRRHLVRLPRPLHSQARAPRALSLAPDRGVLALLVTAVVRRAWPKSPAAAKLWLYFFVATASHGFLDAMTNGGLGVAFFAPFSDARYSFPWRPIMVSPISLHVFFGYRGVRVMWSELGWIWLPAALIFLAGLALRRRPPGGPTSRRLP